MAAAYDVRRELDSRRYSWRNFAHTSDPNKPPTAGKPCSGQAANWPRFHPGGDEVTLVLDAGSIVPAHGLKQAECNAFATAYRAEAAA